MELSKILIDWILNVATAPATLADTSGVLNWQKQIKTSDTTASSYTTTGAIVSAGGLDVAGQASIGRPLRVTNATGSTSYSTGAITAVGGLGITGDCCFGKNVSMIGGGPFILYVEASALKWRGSTGTITTLAPA